MTSMLTARRGGLRSRSWTSGKHSSQCWHTSVFPVSAHAASGKRKEEGSPEVIGIFRSSPYPDGLDLRVVRKAGPWAGNASPFAGSDAGQHI